MKKTNTRKSFAKWLAAAALILVLCRHGWRRLVARRWPMTRSRELMRPAAELQAVKLNPPNLKRGLPFMEALAVRASAREFSEKELSLQDLSDLLWAADGINRPAENKSTASSAMNAHDIRIYVFMKDGAYLYDSPKHELLPVLAGDFRSQIMMARPPAAAASCLAAPAAPRLQPLPPSTPAAVHRLAPPAVHRIRPSRSSWSPTRDRFTHGDARAEVRVGRPRRRHRFAEHLAVLRRHRPEDPAQGLDGQGQDQGAAQADRRADRFPEPPRRLREIVGLPAF